MNRNKNNKGSIKCLFAIMLVVTFIHLMQVSGSCGPLSSYYGGGYGGYIGYTGSPGYASWSSLYAGSPGYTFSDYYPFKAGYSSTIPFMQPWSQTLRAGQSYQYGWMSSYGWGTRYPLYSLSSSYFGGYPFSQGISPYFSSSSPWPYMSGGTKMQYSSPTVIQGTKVTGRVIGTNKIDSNGKIISCYTITMVQAAYGELDLSHYLGMVVEVSGDLQMSNNSHGSLYSAKFERVIS